MSKLTHFEPRAIPNNVPDGAAAKLVGWCPKLKGQIRFKSTTSLTRPRIAVYMRYSSDKQDEYSFDRQMLKVRAYAAQLGGDIVLVFGDAGESGYWSVNREEFQQMLQAADRRLFDVLLFENGDRLSRRAHITTSVYAKLADCGIEVHSTRDGRWGILQAALWGAVSEEQRNRLSELIRSGIVKLVTKGLWPGRVPYGYAKPDAIPNPIEGLLPIIRQPGEMFIDQKRAAVVRRMFKMRRSGIGVHTMADIFNAENIAPPRGKAWTGQAIRYLLQNTLYIGVGIYCKTRQQRREVGDRMVWEFEQFAREEWLYFERPDLAILDDLEDWHAVQQLMKEAPSYGPNRTNLLSRLTFCGVCGAPMSIAGGERNRRKIRCSKNRKKKNQRKCTQPEVTMESVEDTVITLVREKLDVPAAASLMKEGYNRKVEHEQAALNAERRRLEQDRLAIRKKLDATNDATLVAGLTTKVIAEQRTSLCERLDEIDIALASIPAVRLSSNPFIVAPSDSISYLNALVPGKDYRSCDEPLAQLVATFRRLVGRVVVDCDKETKRVTVRLEGPIADVDGSASREFVPATRVNGRLHTAFARARRGDFTIPDAAWASISDRLPCQDIWLDDLKVPLPMKTVIEAMLYLKHTRVGAPNLPESVWPHRIHVWSAARTLSYYGVLDEVERLLKGADVDLVNDITLRIEANCSRKANAIESFVEANARRRARILSKLTEESASAA